MTNPSAFRTLPEAQADSVEIEFDGTPLRVCGNRSVAAALLAHGIQTFRQTPVSSAPRGPYCMMGVCFECLLEIDGAQNRQACLTEVRKGMKIRTQKGARSLPLAEKKPDER